MTPDYQKTIDRYYESGSALCEILIRHSRQVADKALAIAARKAPDLDATMIEAAAMLHDIGICRCHAPSIECHGTEPYICHGVIGASMLRAEGAPEWLARICETHTGAGLTPEDIAAQSLPLPPGDYVPRTQLERLICYADKFYSKSGDMREKPLDRVIAGMRRFGPDTLARFMAMHAEFGED